MVLQGLTDNRGNTYAVSKLMTSKFPLVVILAELASQLRARGMGLNLTWAPRDQNEEADALTNGEHSAFDSSRRVPVERDKVPWIILPAMLKAAGEIYDSAKEAKGQGGESAAGPALKRGRMRERDPW